MYYICFTLINSAIKFLRKWYFDVNYFMFFSNKDAWNKKHETGSWSTIGWQHQLSAWDVNLCSVKLWCALFIILHSPNIALINQNIINRLIYNDSHWLQSGFIEQRYLKKTLMHNCVCLNTPLECISCTSKA